MTTIDVIFVSLLYLTPHGSQIELTRKRTEIENDVHIIYLFISPPKLAAAMCGSGFRGVGDIRQRGGPFVSLFVFF